MTEDEEQALQDVGVILPALLRALEGVLFLTRHLHPFAMARALAAVGEPEAALKETRPRLERWPASVQHARTALATASDAALAAYAGLRLAAVEPEGMMTAFRALRHVPEALAALYPMARDVPPVNAFFLDPARRGDETLLRRLAEAPLRDDTGAMHIDNAPGTRGGWSLYVPEYYSDDRAWPVVFALHGGSGHGNGFLWTWLRDARSHGAILVSPTAKGQTWALQGEDVDTPNLKQMLAAVRSRYRVDDTRLLMTGLSDGGTFTYVSGLEAGSPFTHLAPVAAAFHPMLAEFADRERLKDLPIHIVHGTLDWMFPAEMAQQAARTLTAAGARVTYEEIGDLSHTYPREVNAKLLAWLAG